MPGNLADDDFHCYACCEQQKTPANVPTQITAVEYDVIIIGNGPSSISLSYMLSGNTPYFNPTGGVPEDDILHLRLNWQDPSLPLTEMNVQELSESLEGRTSNPVALVFDQLCHPYADMGLRIPSQLQWRLQEDRAISHLVIGTAKQPGGVWQGIQGDMKTLSKASWMELPSLPFNDFLQTQQEGDCLTIGADSKLGNERASMDEVKGYYEYYVKANNMESNFLNHSIVTSVEKINQVSEEGDGDFTYWLVNGKRLDNTCATNEEKTFTFTAKNIVLAVGTSDVPNLLKVPGESLPFIKHSVSNMESAFSDVNHAEDPVLVVGAGLSASDAILAARKQNMNVIHVFRETPCGNPKMMLRSLPKAIYPEYVWMYELMCGDTVADWYTPYPEFSVREFTENQQVVLIDDLNNVVTRDISLALIRIGASPNLSFLPTDGRNLGLVKDMRIDAKHNQIDINPYTYESNVEKGLYALGPLVGDNFVRFLKGGALAITKDILMKNGFIKM